MAIALDKLGFRHLYGQNQVEPVQQNIAFDIASLVLYGTQALPIRLKILLDRLFSVLQREEVLQVLHGFGWTQEDYARGYILQEPHGGVLDRWNICSPEEEPLVLQQFLRFGETRAITQQLLLAQADQAAALACAASNERNRDRESSDREKDKEREKEREREKQNLVQQQMKVEADLRKYMDKSCLKTPKIEPGMEDRKSHREEKSSRSRCMSPGRSPPQSHHSAQLQHRPSSAAPPSPLHKPSPLNFLKLPTQNGPNSSVSSPTNNVNTSPLSVSPLNRLQSMQPFDFRKMAAAASTYESGKRRASETSDTSPTLNVGNPPLHLPPPLPIPSSISGPVNLSHSTSNLVASSFPGLIPPTSGGESKSPSFSLERGNNSEFGSDDDEDDEENSHSALNLSKDGYNRTPKKPNHHRKGVSPLKRAWGAAGGLPLNLGTQFISPATGKKRVQCNVCLKTFCDKGALKIHFSAVHLREMHKCTVEGCNMMFSSRRSRNRHSANPNPKLHSPHLRRKISPHDGRSSHPHHPMLIPPHSALSLPGSGLNPLSFGAFPLLTPPPELRHQAALDLKQSLDLTMSKLDDRRPDFNCNTNQSSEDGNQTIQSQYDYMDDEEDYEGIVVVGDDEHDPDNEENNEKNSEEDVNSKRAKMSVSDMDDVVSNVDSNEDSLSVVDNQSLKEESCVDGAVELTVKAKRGRKRKNQNPTKCSVPVRQLNDDGMSTDGEGSPDNLFPKKEPKRNEDDLKDDEPDSKNGLGPISGSKSEIKDNITSFFPTMKFKKEENDSGVENEVKEDTKRCNSPGSRHSEDGDGSDALKHLESLSHGHFGEKTSDLELYNSGRVSPARSQASSGSNGIDSPFDENSESLFSLENGFLGVDVPLDKDNPRKCTACGKIFQNHFGVKTHYQNVHLKLMHKCSIEGCNAAFPSKRSRDRHSANLNLHRKLLSTTSDKLGGNIWEKGPFSTNPAFHSDFLSRLYVDPSLHMNFEAYKNSHKADEIMNGDRLLPTGPLPFSPLGFTNFNFSNHPFLHNGIKDHRSDSSSPTSPPHASSPALSVDFDIPTPDREGCLPCKYCNKPFPDGGSLKDHLEQIHISDLFKCSHHGCLKVFTSRSKRNIHYERHNDMSQRRGSTSSNENGS